MAFNPSKVRFLLTLVLTNREGLKRKKKEIEDEIYLKKKKVDHDDAIAQ